MGAGNGLAEGTALDAAALRALNPGLTMQQIDDAFIPRLARPAYLEGTRDRIAGLVSLEYRPTDTMNFYFDTMYSVANREFNRVDMNLVVRNAAFMVPRNLQVDANNVVTSGEFLECAVLPRSPAV